jgi:hypothetical protein
MGVGRLVFASDNREGRSNERKHGISFHEAMSVFIDDFAPFDDDSESSDAEERFVLLGLSSRLRLLVVCHTCRRSDSSSA